MQYTGVYPRHLTHTSHVPPLPVGAFHNESDGVVTARFVCRYSTVCSLGSLNVPLAALTKATNRQTYSGYFYAQYVGTFKGLHTRCRYGKYVQNLQITTVDILIVNTVELHFVD